MVTAERERAVLERASRLQTGDGCGQKLYWSKLSANVRSSTAATLYGIVTLKREGCAKIAWPE
jgi:hypothetical protein